MFDGRHALIVHLGYGQEAGSDRNPIEMNRARAAQSRSTTVLGARQMKVVSQHP